jgi:hypothetical protein
MTKRWSHILRGALSLLPQCDFSHSIETLRPRREVPSRHPLGQIKHLFQLPQLLLFSTTIHMRPRRRHLAYKTTLCGHFTINCE